jgi:uncharacterized protein YegP (UPF0339 family)
VAGKFVVKRARGKFYFNLVADNGRVLATSRTYPAKDDALDAVSQFKALAPTAIVEDAELS